MDESRPAFRTFSSERELQTAVFLAPKAGPESVIEPQALVGLVILESWIAARIARDVEQRGRRNEKHQPNSRWPKIAEWPTDEAVKNEGGRDKGGRPLPTVC